MEQRVELADGFFRRRNIEKLLLMAVLGEESIREQARHELHERRVVSSGYDFEDAFMTNLSVV